MPPQSQRRRRGGRRVRWGRREGPATWGRRPAQAGEAGNKEQSLMKGEQRESVGEEMTLVLSLLGQILVEVADA